MERHRERTEHNELLFGIIASNIANYAGKMLKDNVELKPRDFMPSQAGKPEQINHADVAAQTRAVFQRLIAKQEQAERIRQNVESQKQD